jgi:hypothetical protein
VGSTDVVIGHVNLPLACSRVRVLLGLPLCVGSPDEAREKAASRCLCFLRIFILDLVQQTLHVPIEPG